jgi:hypothetical protein
MSEDPEATLQWLHLLPDDTAKTDVLAVLSKEFADTQPDRAIEFAVMMPEGKAQESTLSTVVGQWGHKDFEGALAWAQEQDPEVRQTLLPQLVRQLAPRDVSAALELALSIGGKAGTGSVNNVVAVWAGKEPVAAATWAAAQPANATYLALVASRWAMKDEPSAREWIKALPAGPSKDGAVLRAVREIARSEEPQIAEHWIAQMGDEAQRHRAYQELAFYWLQADPKQAGAWMRTAPIPAKTKSDLLKRAAK